MSSRRNNNSNGGGGNYSKNTPRGPIRERNSKQPQRVNHGKISFIKLTLYYYIQKRCINLLSPEQSTGDSRAIQTLRRIFNDEDDISFSRRLTNANQLLKLLEESRNTISDSIQFRQEQMQLLDICIYDEGLRRIIEFSKVPSALKSVLAKIVSGLACYTRLDLALSWIFDRLETWPGADKSNAEIIRDREWKKWLLRLLKQVFMRYITKICN